MRTKLTIEVEDAAPVAGYVVTAHYRDGSTLTIHAMRRFDIFPAVSAMVREAMQKSVGG